jgi:hypothetical protein
MFSRLNPAMLSLPAYTAFQMNTWARKNAGPTMRESSMWDL